MTPQELVADYERYKTSRAHHQGPSANNRASVLGHPCFAYAFFDRVVEPKDRRPVDTRLAMIFDEGSAQELILKRDLMAVGYDVIESQGSLYWPAEQISGHRDFKLARNGKVVRCEAKSVNPHWYGGLHTVADVREHKSYIVRKWYSQVLIYMLLDSEDSYWLILKNKSSGEIKILEFAWTDEMWKDASVLLDKARAINGMVREAQDKRGDWRLVQLEEKAKIKDASICPNCEFFEVCLPSLSLGPGVKVIEDADLAADLDAYHEIEQGVDTGNRLYEQIKGTLKVLLKDSDVEAVLVGDWVVRVKRYDVAERTMKASSAVRFSFSRTVRGD